MYVLREVCCGSACVAERVRFSSYPHTCAQIEDKILQMLADSSGDILDDEELINNLAASKTTSEAIGGRMRDAETTSKEINETRELYRPVVSVLRFCDECPLGCCARCFFVSGRPCRERRLCAFGTVRMP